MFELNQLQNEKEEGSSVYFHSKMPKSTYKVLKSAIEKFKTHMVLSYSQWKCSKKRILMIQLYDI